MSHDWCLNLQACVTLPHCVLIAGLANVFNRIVTGSKSFDDGCTCTKAWLELTVNSELELNIKENNHKLL